jgi:hypothetical protein
VDGRVITFGSTRGRIRCKRIAQSLLFGFALFYTNFHRLSNDHSFMNGLDNLPFLVYNWNEIEQRHL